MQEAFKVPLVIQLTDDEKFLWKDLNLDECHRLAFENAKDIIACGFDPRRTFIFSDLDYVGHMYVNIVRIWKAVTYNQARGIFGFEDGTSRSTSARSGSRRSRPRPRSPTRFRTSSGRAEEPAVPHPVRHRPGPVLPHDPRRRAALGFLKPALVESKFFPALKGESGKMSASDPDRHLLHRHAQADQGQGE